MGTFIDLATALGQKIGNMFTKQGVETPVQRPVATQGDSMDFWAGAKKLLQPVTNLFSPTTKAGVQILEGATSVGQQALDALGRNVGSYIDKLFGNGNKAPSQSATTTTNVVREDNAFGSQPVDLGTLFKFFTQIQTGNPSATPAASVPASSSNFNTLLLVGGFVALGAVLLLSARRAK